MGAGVPVRCRAPRSRSDSDGGLNRAERHQRPDHRSVLASDRACGMGRSDAVRHARCADDLDRLPGFGRAHTDGRGEFRFTTVKPGPVPGRGNTQQAPHFAVAVHARGLLKALMTRAYFEGDPLNETDPLLSSIEDSRRRTTLLARPETGDHWRLDLRLQRGPHGETETVFLDL